MPLPKIHGTFLCMAVVVLPTLFAFDPAATWWFPSCPLRSLTGWLCPLCGSLRAIHALVHGDPLVALALNPLVTAGVLIGMAALVSDAVRPVRTPVRTTRFEGLLARCFGARGLAVAFAFAVLRNLPRA
ncbi:MAG: DUF2752 domain-containing protein [Acidobacteriota bacterium]